MSCRVESAHPSPRWDCAGGPDSSRQRIPACRHMSQVICLLITLPTSWPGSSGAVARVFSVAFDRGSSALDAVLGVATGGERWRPECSIARDRPGATRRVRRSNKRPRSRSRARKQSDPREDQGMRRIVFRLPSHRSIALGRPGPSGIDRKGRGTWPWRRSRPRTAGTAGLSERARGTTRRPRRMVHHSGPALHPRPHRDAVRRAARRTSRPGCRCRSARRLAGSGRGPARGSCRPASRRSVPSRVRSESTSARRASPKSIRRGGPVRRS